MGEIGVAVPDRALPCSTYLHNIFRQPQTTQHDNTSRTSRISDLVDLGVSNSAPGMKLFSFSSAQSLVFLILVFLVWYLSRECARTDVHQTLRTIENQPPHDAIVEPLDAIVEPLDAIVEPLEPPGTSLQRWANTYKGPVLWKWSQYFGVYERVFGRLKGARDVTSTPLWLYIVYSSLYLFLNRVYGLGRIFF
jgi:hypothetical protein